MTTKEAAQILAVLTAAYPNAYKNLTAKEAAAVSLVWAAQFADVPYDIVFMALQKAISTCKYAPTICEVKDKITSLHWEAYDEIREHQAGNRKLSEEELTEYNRIYDITDTFKYRKPEPELRTMLPHAQQTLPTRAAHRELGEGIKE